MDGRGATAALRDRRAVPGRLALLVAVRASGIDAQSLRARQYAQYRVRIRFSQQLVPVDELDVPDSFRAGDGVGVDQTRCRTKRTVDADEVRMGAGVRRARLRDSRAPGPR